MGGWFAFGLAVLAWRMDWGQLARAFANLRSGPWLVALALYLLIQAVSHTQERLKMPFGGDKLKDEEIADLAAWVKSGAPWPATTPAATSGDYVITPEQRRYWAFQPVRKPALPVVSDPSWPKSSPGTDRTCRYSSSSRAVPPVPSWKRASPADSICAGTKA